MFTGPNDLRQVPNLFSPQPFMTYDWTIGYNSIVVVSNDESKNYYNEAQNI